MISRIIRSARDFIATAAIFSTVGYGYLFYLAYQNQQRYLQSIKADTLKDASRLTNESFGISWGFQADDTIMSRIDSGDLLFMKFECWECLSANRMLQCIVKTVHFIDEEYHSVGYAFRDESGLYVLYNEFGETKVKNYCELLSIPYLLELSLQKATPIAARQHHHNLKAELQREGVISESPKQFARRIHKLLGQGGSINSIQQLLLGEQRINIRTETNKSLRSL